MVIRAMAGTLQKLGANPGRSGHALSLASGRIIQNCRELLADTFGAPAPENVIFTPSCTEALNTELMEFTESACLRLFVTVAGSNISKLHGHWFIEKTVLKECSYSTCSAFGLECD